LLPSVAPTVRLGLWSLVVLEKAGKSLSEAYQHDLPLLDGIFYVVQGLAQGGVVGSSHDSTTTATRNNKNLVYEFQTVGAYQPSDLSFFRSLLCLMV
jgi:hypothetical protein